MGMNPREPGLQLTGISRLCLLCEHQATQVLILNGTHRESVAGSVSSRSKVESWRNRNKSWVRPSLNLSPWLPLCPPPSVSSKWTEHALNQGSLTPRPWISGPARNWAAQQEVSGRGTGKASSLCPAAPHPSHYRLSSASCQINDSIRVSKKHSERNALESSGNRPPAPPHRWINRLPQNQSLLPKILGTAALNAGSRDSVSFPLLLPVFCLFISEPRHGASWTSCPSLSPLPGFTGSDRQTDSELFSQASHRWVPAFGFQSQRPKHCALKTESDDLPHFLCFLWSTVVAGGFQELVKLQGWDSLGFSLLAGAPTTTSKFRPRQKKRKQGLSKGFSHPMSSSCVSLDTLTWKKDGKCSLYLVNIDTPDNTLALKTNKLIVCRQLATTTTLTHRTWIWANPAR